MTKDEALKLALEKFEFMNHVDSIFEGEFNFQINAIKEALAQPEPWEKFCDSNCVWTDHHPDCKLTQPEQEPYCWTWDVWVSGGKWRAEYGWKKPTEKVVNLQPLYTATPQRKPLTDKELNLIGAQWHYNLLGKDDKAELFAFSRAIEAAHGIKD